MFNVIFTQVDGYGRAIARAVYDRNGIDVRNIDRVAYYFPSSDILFPWSSLAARSERTLSPLSVRE